MPNFPAYFNRFLNYRVILEPKATESITFVSVLDKSCMDVMDSPSENDCYEDDSQ